MFFWVSVGVRRMNIKVNSWRCGMSATCNKGVWVLSIDGMALQASINEATTTSLTRPPYSLARSPASIRSRPLPSREATEAVRDWERTIANAVRGGADVGMGLGVGDGWRDRCVNKRFAGTDVVYALAGRE